jgi:hypothetical protein
MSAFICQVLPSRQTFQPTVCKHFLFHARCDTYNSRLGKTHTVRSICNYLLRRALMQPKEHELHLAAKGQMQFTLSTMLSTLFVYLCTVHLICLSYHMAGLLRHNDLDKCARRCS